MDTFEFNVDEKMRPAVERKLTGTTKMDCEIAGLPLPHSRVLRTIVRMLRAYRKLTPKAVRCRCVFDPSCSHYSELAFRQHGVVTGMKLTLGRLSRCKRGAGGVDLSNVKYGE